MKPRKLLDDDFIAKIDQLELVSRKVISGVLKGDRLSKRRGHSNEFADHRPYVPGDDLRFLDWNVYGRLDRLFLKVFLEEEDLGVSILVDSSPSMGFGDPDKLFHAKRIAAALGYIGLINHDRVQVASFGDATQALFGPARGRRQVRRMLEVLEELPCQDSGGTDMQRSCREFAHAQRGGGILLFISDFLDRRGFETALRYLLIRARTTEIFVFHVLADEEIEPDLTGDLQLVDIEDGLAAEVSVSGPLLKRYRRTVELFREEIHDYCARRGMHYIFTSTSAPFDRLILEFLRRRGLLR